MGRKLAFDDLIAKRLGDLYIDRKFPVNACRRKVLHGRYYAKRLEAKQVVVATALFDPHQKRGESRSVKGEVLFSLCFLGYVGVVGDDAIGFERVEKAKHLVVKRLSFFRRGSERVGGDTQAEFMRPSYYLRVIAQ